MRELFVCLSVAVFVSLLDIHSTSFVCAHAILRSLLIGCQNVLFVLCVLACIVPGALLIVAINKLVSVLPAVCTLSANLFLEGNM